MKINLKKQSMSSTQEINKEKKVEVVAAIVKYENEILCVQRSKSKYDYISEKFEFPGGKIETGESNKQALKRELIEELYIMPTIGKLFLTVDFKYPDFNLLMHCYSCTIDNKLIKLNEHISAKWLSINELEQLDWAAADIPIVKKLVK